MVFVLFYFIIGLFFLLRSIDVENELWFRWYAFFLWPTLVVGFLVAVIVGVYSIFKK